MTIKTSIYIALVCMALLVAIPVSGQLLCDFTDHQDEVSACAGGAAESSCSDDCQDESGCETGCLDCGLSSCGGLACIMIGSVRLGNIDGFSGRTQVVDQGNFWVGLDSFFHPPQILS
ncbi:MAG: hypothetical protein GY780_01575 [bacterium]|nr:hypothetical protein [bacterium]